MHAQIDHSFLSKCSNSHPCCCTLSKEIDKLSLVKQVELIDLTGIQKTGLKTSKLRDFLLKVALQQNDPSQDLNNRSAQTFGSLLATLI